MEIESNFIENLSKDKIPKENLGPVYFDLMKEKSTEVHIKISEFIKQFESIGEFSRYKKLYEQMLKMPEARSDKSIMRSTITDLMYRLYDGNKDIDITPALAISELNNINAYLDNIILDNKKNIWKGNDVNKKIGETTITSGIFRELTERIILEIETSDSNKIKILKSLSECMTKSYQGQQLDFEVGLNEIGNFKDDKSYLRRYLTKSKLQSGYLYGFSAKIGAILAGANEKQISEAEKIGQTIGLGIHISNDLGDFAVAKEPIESTGFKAYQDQLADLKNGRLTFPIYYVIKHGTEQEKQALLKIVKVNNESATQEDFLAASRAIHTSGAFEFGKKFIRRYYKDAKNMIHKNYPESRERGILSAIPSAIISNKFLTILKESKE